MRKQKGFTLIELLLVIGIGSIITTLAVQKEVRDVQTEQVKAASSQVSEYVKAVREYRTANPADTTLGVQAGMGWPKSSACADPGVIVGSGYLPCNFNSSVRYVPDMTTDLSVANEALVTIDPVTVGGEERLDMSGIMARTLQVAVVNSGLGTTSVVDLETNTLSTDFSKVMVDINADTATDPWIRTDGLNVPTAAISWGNQDLSNVNNFQAAVGNITTVNSTNVNATNNVAATNEVTAGVQMQSPRYVDSDDSTFVVDPNGTSVMDRVDASIVYDRDNPAYYLDPANVSQTEDMRANIFRDTEDPTNRYIDPANVSQTSVMRSTVFQDMDDTNFYTDPNGKSRLRTTDFVAQNSGAFSVELKDHNGNSIGSPEQWRGSMRANDIFIDSKNVWLSQVAELALRAPRWVHMGTYLVYDGSKVIKPACRAGGVPRILVNHARFLTNLSNAGAYREVVSAYAVDLGWGWRTYIRAYYGNGGATSWYNVGLASAYCYY